MYINIADVDGMPKEDDMGADLRKHMKRVAEKKRGEAICARAKSEEYVPKQSEGPVEYTPLDAVKKTNGPSDSLVGPHTV